jgi:hypothetical protein
VWPERVPPRGARVLPAVLQLRPGDRAGSEGGKEGTAGMNAQGMIDRERPEYDRGSMVRPEDVIKELDRLWAAILELQVAFQKLSTQYRGVDGRRENR